MFPGTKILLNAILFSNYSREQRIRIGPCFDGYQIGPCSICIADFLLPYRCYLLICSSLLVLSTEGMANFLHQKFSFICICSLVKCRTVLLSIRVKRTSYRHQLFCHILVWFVSANYIYMTEVLSCFQPPCQFTCLVSLGAIAKGKKKRKKMYLPGYYVQGLVFSTKIVGQFYGHSLWSHSIFVSKNVLLRTCRRVA